MKPNDNISWRAIVLCIWLLAAVRPGDASARLTLSFRDTVPSDTLRDLAYGEPVTRSIYPADQRTKSKVYNWLWGVHYRKLYTIPITVPAFYPSRYKGGLSFVRQAPDFHGLLMKNDRDRYVLLRPLGGSTSFIESDFFREMYRKKDFKDTYMNEFIGDAYTIINPYTFLVADRLGEASGQISTKSDIYYVPADALLDTVADGNSVQNKLVNLIEVPDLHRANVHTTAELLDSLRSTKSNEVDQALYLRERLLDMVIGDWNKIPENWYWISSATDSVAAGTTDNRPDARETRMAGNMSVHTADSFPAGVVLESSVDSLPGRTVDSAGNSVIANRRVALPAAAEEGRSYRPIVIDRNHAFTKVDGVMFKQMLNVLTLGFIINYDSLLTRKNIKKLNTLGFPIDMAVAGQSDEAAWRQQAALLKSQLTDDVIEEAFRRLPASVRREETEALKGRLKTRRDQLDTIARQYYRQLQHTPVLTATDRNDRIVADYYDTDSLRIRMYDAAGRPVFDHHYGRSATREIWLYGLDGNDTFQVTGRVKKPIPLFLISGKGENTYDVAAKHGVRIYAYPDQKERLDSVQGAKKIVTGEESVHAYDYEKIKHHTLSFTPWGIYDTDRGISLGAFLTYTEYGFKRAPFTYRHRIGYNYLEGFMYQGVFPDYTGRHVFYIDATVGSPRNFSNFFGYGNDTYGYKDEKRKYNQVKIRKYALVPSYHLKWRDQHELIFSTAFNMYKAKRTEGRYIAKVFLPDNPIFKMNYFLNLGATYHYEKALSERFPKVEATFTGGWVMNLKKTSRNFPYTEASLGWNLQIVPRFVWATLLKGKVLYNDKYEFYQSASVELRGFRDNRFIGQQSYYQYSDFRLDMGKLENPFTPLKYGLFAGFDYGRVWYPGEHSRRWHTSYGGGLWLTILNKITTKYSFFGSSDTFRFTFELGLGF